jgi:serine/threonine protein kinase
MEHQEPGATYAEPCPEEDTVFAFCRGGLSGEPLAAMELHIDSCEGCRLAVAEAMTCGGARRPSGRLLAPATLAAGDVLADRYRIVRFIASGGMGEVYEAADVVLGGRIAVKIVSATISDDPKALARLRSEVQTARKVTHPNVCRIFDLGQCEQGLFLTMELLDGETLGARIRGRGRLSPDEVLVLLPQMVGALSAAHRAGIVHRDFKSDNLMLCKGEDGAERVVVMDFGLARSIVVEPGVQSLTTGKGLVGSVGYMAPEQVSGQRAVSPAIDVYALGVVLYEMLTGVLPFAGKTPVATALMRLAMDAPSPRKFVPSLDPLWEGILARCLARHPAARFASVDAIVDALRAPPAPRERWSAATKGAAVAVAVVLLYLLVRLVLGSS